MTPPVEPGCDRCRAVGMPLEQVNTGRYCHACAPLIWEGLRRMAEARRAAGRPLNHWDRRALGTLAHAPREVA